MTCIVDWRCCDVLADNHECVMALGCSFCLVSVTVKYTALISCSLTKEKDVLYEKKKYLMKKNVGVNILLVENYRREYRVGFYI